MFQRFTLYACAMLLIGFALQANSVAQEVTTPSFSIEKLKLDQTDWHGIYIAGGKSGYLSSRYEKRKSEGQETIAAVENFVIKMVSMEQKIKMEFTQELVFDAKPPYRMVSGSMSVKDGNGGISVNATVEGTTLTAKILSAGNEETIQKVEDFNYDLLTNTKLEMLDWKNAKVGDEVKFDEFDLSELKFDEQTYRITKVKQSTAGGVAFKFFETEVSSEDSGKLGTFRLGEDGGMISAIIGGMFEARKETAETAKNFDYSADLFVRGTLRLNKPIGDPNEVVALETKINELIANAIQIGPVQNFEKRGDDYVLTLGKSYGKDRPIEDGDIEDNLKETGTLPVNHPTIQKLVKEAIGDETDPTKKAKLLITFVSDFVEDSYDANAFSVLDICKNKNGDCTEHSMLFATMARAAGIPCREVSGFVYMGDEVKAFGGHAWNEIILDGKWWPVDATWDEFDVNPTHIQIKKESEFEVLGMGMRMRLLKLETK